jgi:hypothetical protein
MATSGSTDWTLNRDQVIAAALRKLSVLSSGQTPNAAQVADTAVALNGLVKTLQADGMPLWKITSHTFTVTSGTETYNIGEGETLNVPKPLRVLQAFVTPAGGIAIPLNIYTRYNFNELPIDSSGVPVNLYYQPLNDYGVIKLWPIPEDSTTEVTIHYQSMFEDMDAAANNFDFPSEWITPITYLLAWMMAPEFGIPLQDTKEIRETAAFWLGMVQSMGSEEGSVFLQPDVDR